MRARANDPRRTMAQKILAARSDEAAPSTDLVRVKVDQIVLTRCPSRVLAESFALGLKKAQLETVVIYDGRCLHTAAQRPEEIEAVLDDPSFDPTAFSLTLARAGIGAPPAVHLERFAAPGRLLLTDDPRLATVGGAGMLTVVVPASQLALALVEGTAWIRAPRSVQISLSGRLRPFVCARDVLHELLKRNVDETVKKIELSTGCPIVLEFAGPSAKLLSVSDRAVLASVAPLVGAAGALFISDEKTESYLRDQRRSKAHRALAPDPGSSCEDVVPIDLGTVDPTVLDPLGVVRSVRDVAGKPVAQVILGGDGTCTARDMLAAANLLKSKKISAKLDFLVVPPSRQTLEIIAKSGALNDLLATGARLIEADRLLAIGEYYPPPNIDAGVSIRSFDTEPFAPGAGSYIASAETLAYAVAHAQLGDPRTFKRPVKVQLPRELPTEDQLVVRERRDAPGTSKKPPTIAPMLVAHAFRTEEKVTVYEPSRRRLAKGAMPELWSGAAVDGPWIAICTSPAELRQVALRSARLASAAKLRAVVATHFSLYLVSVLSGHGILCLQCDAEGLKVLSAANEVVLPCPQYFMAAKTELSVGTSKVTVVWVAQPLERSWVMQTTQVLTPPTPPAPTGKTKKSDKSDKSDKEPKAKDR